MPVSYEWCGRFTSAEVNALHAEAFDTRVYADSEWNWQELTRKHSLGWVTARDRGELVGFVNVIGDGLVHAWIQDTMVAASARRRGIATRLIAIATERTREGGYEWLHVDFDDDLRDFYLGACGFTPTYAGLLSLQRPD